MKLDFELQAIEGNPELARVVGPNEMVVLVSMELRMHEVSGVMNLCLPYIVMEPAIQRLGQGTMTPARGGSEPARNRGALEDTVRGSTVRVDVELGHVTVRLRELLALEEGDVLRFGSPSRRGATMLVEGVPRVEGSAGRSQGHLAFRAGKVLPGADGRMKDE